MFRSAGQGSDSEHNYFWAIKNNFASVILCLSNMEKLSKNQMQDWRKIG